MNKNLAITIISLLGLIITALAIYVFSTSSQLTRYKNVFSAPANEVRTVSGKIESVDAAKKLIVMSVEQEPKTREIQVTNSTEIISIINLPPVPTNVSASSESAATPPAAVNEKKQPSDLKTGDKTTANVSAPSASVVYSVPPPAMGGKKQLSDLKVGDEIVVLADQDTAGKAKINAVSITLQEPMPTGPNNDTSNTSTPATPAPQTPAKK